MKHLILLIFWGLSLLAGPTLTTAQDAPSDWELLRTRIQQGELLESQFSMHWINAEGILEQQAKGLLILWKDGYRIESGESQRLVYEGLSRVIDHQQQQFIVSEYLAEDDDFAPARLLDSTYLASFELSSPKVNHLLWKTQDPFETFKELEIVLKQGFVYQMNATDQLDNQIRLQLSQNQWVAPDSNFFILQAPKEYRRVDLRQEADF
jgi:hypothetical protein